MAPGEGLVRVKNFLPARIRHAGGWAAPREWQPQACSPSPLRDGSGSDTATATELVRERDVLLSDLSIMLFYRRCLNGLELSMAIVAARIKFVMEKRWCASLLFYREACSRHFAPASLHPPNVVIAGSPGLPLFLVPGFAHQRRRPLRAGTVRSDPGALGPVGTTNPLSKWMPVTAKRKTSLAEAAVADRREMTGRNGGRSVGVYSVDSGFLWDPFHPSVSSLLASSSMIR